MELKLGISYCKEHFKWLLIVPYGIETSVEITLSLASYLLIVPYGIETLFLR